MEGDIEEFKRRLMDARRKGTGFMMIGTDDPGEAVEIMRAAAEALEAPLDLPDHMDVYLTVKVPIDGMHKWECENEAKEVADRIADLIGNEYEITDWYEVFRDEDDGIFDDRDREW